MKKLCVIGLGYVGLPLAMQARKNGFDVIGVDISKKIVDEVNNGISHIKEDFLLDLFNSHSIKATTEIPSGCDAYIVCVPTPVTSLKDPDLTSVKNAVISIAKLIDDGQLVVIESTINPGVSEEIIKPILDTSGKNYLLAHCPERINPGDKKWNVSNIPRVVGGLTPEATIKAKELYEKIVDANITPLSQIKAAEATKIMENTFRDINIAFVNEMAQSFYKLGIDISEVIKGASTKPFAFMPHYPGIGVGGHCIAVDPYYMIKRGRDVGFEHNFLIRARKINSGMPRYCANAVQNGLNFMGLPINGTKIAVLGLAYKPDVSDDRESPSYDIINILESRKGDIATYDPYLLDKSTAKTLKQAIKDAKCVIIATAHKEFIDEEIYKDIPFIFDGRNCLDKIKISKNTIYRGVGSATPHESATQYC